MLPRFQRAKLAPESFIVEEVEVDEAHIELLDLEGPAP